MSDPTAVAHRFNVTLVLRTPVLSQRLEASDYGVDASGWVRRVDGDDYPALPGSLVRGNLRASWTALADVLGAEASDDGTWPDAGAIARYLGSESASDNVPRPRRLGHSDAWIADRPICPARSHRVAIDAKTGAAGPGLLQSVEVPFPAGETLRYTGWFEARTSAEEAATLAIWLKKGLEFVPALGAFKGIGFGKLVGVEVDGPSVAEVEPVAAPGGFDQFGMSLQLDRPICFAKPHVADSNRYESYEFIPGGAIIAAIANGMRALGGAAAFPNLSAHLNELSVTHAHPRDADELTRPATVPLSVYWVGKHECYDAAQESDVELLAREEVRFVSDWKDADWRTCQDAAGQARPRGELRVRTAVDSQRGTAKRAALFSWDTVRTDAHVWRANVALTAVPQAARADVNRELSAVLGSGLRSLGKTDARARVTLSPEPFLPVQPSADLAELSVGQTVRIVLQSDALLFANIGDVDPTNGGDALMAVYADYWDTQSGHALSLNTFFAQQAFYGGTYYWRRYKAGAQGYAPHLVTRAGSVFVLTVNDADAARANLRRWQALGLPSADGDDWQTNPLRPNNGYGEVVIDPDITALCDAAVALRQAPEGTDA